MHQQYGKSYFDRFDLALKDIKMRKRFEDFLINSPPDSIDGELVKEIISIDGIKLRLNKRHWLMFRFSGTEPLLRIYCEAPTEEKVASTLLAARNFLEDQM